MTVLRSSISSFYRSRPKLTVLISSSTVLGSVVYYSNCQGEPSSSSIDDRNCSRGLIRLESKRDPLHPENIPPPLLWTPPTRKQIIKALSSSRLVSQISVDDSEDDDDGRKPHKNQSEEGTAGALEDEYDLLIIGGGATGAGVALDASSRGLRVALVERDDFSSGTSSKSTKLVHGGVRYLQKAIFGLDYEQYKLVREALHERKTFLHIAPHLSLHLPIMLPVYKWWQVPYYYAGCKMYDILAGSENMETSYLVGKGKALENFPMLKSDGLCGAVVYYDGSHNDSRMNMALVMSAIHQGAVVANHVEVTELHKVPPESKPDVNPKGSPETPGVIAGARLRDKVTGKEFNVRAKGVINATGPFCDGIRKLDDPKTQNIVAPSSGVHITLPSYYAPSHMGLIDPDTSDGRVIFFLPWQGNAIAGTTDSPAPVEQDPLPKEEEIQWVLGEVRNYLSPELKVRRGDVLSAWCGLRPLVRNPAAKDSQSLVRNHMIHVSPSGLLTIAGGKWTTYRAMAEETVDAAIKTFNLKPRRGCITKHLQLIGAHGWHKTLYIKLIQDFGLESEVAKHLTDNYGDRAWSVCSLTQPTGNRWPVHGRRLDQSYPYLEEEVRYSVRNEYAVTPIDVIARRTRLAFLNSQAALEVLPKVIDIMSDELGWTSTDKETKFNESRDFLLSMGLPKSKTKLSLQDVRRGLLRKQTQEEGQLFSRAMFSPKELIQLRKEFNELDISGEGKILSKDIEKALEHLNFSSVDEETVSSIVSGVKVNDSGSIDFSDFLDIAVAAKEVSLSKKLQTILKNGSNGGPADGDEKIQTKRNGGEVGLNDLKHKLTSPLSYREEEEDRQRKDGLLAEKDEAIKKTEGTGQGSKNDERDGSLITNIEDESKKNWSRSIPVERSGGGT
ncbi:glycerol-3-phosphate dehydrogenase [Phakopsora pachyrhizi]|uniref:Glycerol-3-phosphate dehydrogenase n=1 Tax=Phakopsora pachyrhizi TaxID=170000 RepID=A0AAV0B0V7_PHAPC|nr:glycerol-3-phosphate dehydrogenase [Phakopsora pachyrhizi]